MVVQTDGTDGSDGTLGAVTGGGATAEIPGGNQFPLTQDQSAPGRTDVQPVLEVGGGGWTCCGAEGAGALIPGGSQFPLTHTQSAAGRTEVHVVVAGGGDDGAATGLLTVTDRVTVRVFPTPSSAMTPSV
jgi:hypothetical protein